MPPENPLVSIVVPAYNGARYIRDAINSILQQEYPCIELLVFDDGSKDDTPHILEQYGQQFYWESHSNMGQSATLNKGWQMARGEILSYLSVDDVLWPNAVSQAVIALAENPQAPVVYGDYDLIDESGNQLRRINAPDFDYRRLISELEVQPGPGAFFRREAFEFSQGWNPRLKQTPDYDFWLKVGLLGRFMHVGEIWASFRVHPESQSYAEASPNKADEYVSVIEAFYSHPDLPAEIVELRPKAISTSHAVSTRAHIRAGRYGQALAHLKQAIASDWRSLFRSRVWKMVLSGVYYRLGRAGPTS